MKRLLITALALATAFTSGAQKKNGKLPSAPKAPVKVASLDRSIKPKAGPAPVISLKEPASFELPNGLKVYVVENHKLPVVSVSMELNYLPPIQGAKAGIMDITGQMIGRGTAKRNKETFDKEIDQIGGTFSASNTGFYAGSLKRNFSKVMELASDAILNAKFTSEEFEKVKTKSIDAVKSSKEEAGEIADNVRKRVNFGSAHPYGEITTEESLSKVTLEDCQKFFQTYFRPNIGFMAIVGDITPDEAKKLVEEYFANWTKAEVPMAVYPKPKLPAAPGVYFANKDGAVQSVINLTHPIDIVPGHPDAIKLSVMNTMLGDGDARLFKNLRETKAYTYGAYSTARPDRLAGTFNAFANVRNAVTDSAVDQFLFEINRIRNEKASNTEVEQIKNFMTGSFAINLESPQTIAAFAINIARYNLPKDYYQNYLKNLAAVTAEDVQMVAQKYLQPDKINLVVVGDKDEIAPKLQRFSQNKIQYFDYKADIQEEAMPVPAGVTAEKVIAGYLNALGGVDKINKIKDISMNMSASFQGMALTAEMRKKSPDKYLMEVKMNGAMVVQKQVYDGTKGKASGMGGEKELTGEELEEVRANTKMVPEMEYVVPNSGYKLTLKGMEKINGKDAFKLEVETPWKKKGIEYYDAASGLKVQEVKMGEGPEGPISLLTTYDDYREVNGVKFAFKIGQSFGPQMIEMKATSIETNKKLKDDLFKVN